MEEFINNFYEILEDTEKGELQELTKFRELDEWDSMTILMLFAMMEEKYDVKVTVKVLENLISLKDLYEFTKRK